MNGDQELNPPAGPDPGLDKGPKGVNREEHKDGEDKAEKEVEAGVGQLGTDGLDAHLGMEAGSSIPAELHLLPPQILSHSRVEPMTEFWKQTRNQHNLSPGNRDPGTNLEAVDELGKRNIATVTERGQSLKVVGIGTVPDLDAGEVMLSRAGPARIPMAMAEA